MIPIIIDLPSVTPLSVCIHTCVLFYFLISDSQHTARISPYLSPGQSVRKSLVFKPADNDNGDKPPPKKKTRKAKKSKAKARSASKKPASKTASAEKSVPSDDLDSVMLQWKRKVSALRGLSASEAAAILGKEVQQFEALSSDPGKSQEAGSQAPQRSRGVVFESAGSQRSRSRA